MKKNIILFFFVFFIITYLIVACTACGASQSTYNESPAASSSDTVSADLSGTSSSVSWTEHYYSVDEMVERADIVALVKAVGSKAELRSDMVFTREEFQINSIIKGNFTAEDKIEILFTGGNTGTIRVPPPEDIPLPELNQNYLIFAYETAEDPTYGQYYLLVGGYQGIALINNDGALESLSDLNIEMVNEMSSILE